MWPIIRRFLGTDYWEEEIDPRQLETWNMGKTISTLSLSPDGTRIAFSPHKFPVHIMDTENAIVVLGLLEGHTGNVDSLAFSPDGTRIVSGSSDQTIRIWDARTGLIMGEPLNGHTGDVDSVVFSPDGTRIVSGSWSTLR